MRKNGVQTWLITTASALAVSAIGAPAALGQEAQADDTASANEIVVTAQFRAQSLQDTPLAITAVSGDQLETRGQQSITDIGATTPNVNISTATAIQANAVAAFIRGIGQDDASFALEPGVGLYIDDVYFGTTFGSSLDLVDLERVEVLRGPQGTLAGKNSLGGAIKLYSSKPDEDFGGYVKAGYGRFDKRELRGSINIPLADGLYTRISGSYRKDDGYFKELDYGCVNPGQGIAATGRANSDCVLGRAGGANNLTLRGALRYAPSGSPLEINIVGDYTRDRSQPVATKMSYINNPGVRSYVAGDPAGGVPFDSRFLTPKGSYTSYADYGESGNFTTLFGTFYQQAPGTFPDKRENSVDGWGVSGTIDLELSDSLSLKSITAYRKADGVSLIDVDGTPLNILKERLENHHKQFTQELRLSGKVGDALDFTFGGFYYKANERLEGRFDIPVYLFDFLSDDPVSNRSIAGFAHAEFHATDKLNVIGGIRYTEDKKVYTFSRRNADGSVITGIPFTPNFTVASLDGVVGRFSGNRWDYRIGVNYEWNSRVMTYLQLATGYKGGGVNPRPFVADQATSFAPETLTTYEGGVKASFLRGAVIINASAFYNDYKDIQRTVYLCLDSVSTACGKPVNAGDGESYGAEFELNVRPATGWQINSSLSVMDFKYKSINPLTGITLDMDAPFVNKIQASVGIQYEADLGGAGWLTPRFDAAYQSDFHYQAINSPYNLVPERTIANARVTYATPKKDLEVSLQVSNLFDKYYAVARQENIAAFGNAQEIIGRPREWSVSVKKTF